MNHSKTNFRLGISNHFCFLLLVALMVCGCNPAEEKKKTSLESGPSNRVVAASYPLQYLTQRIVGGKVKVDFPVDKKVDPREWSPSIEQIQNLQAADLVVVNGAGAAYAKWLVRVSLLPSKICNSVDGMGLSDYFMVNDYQIVHTHGPEGEHSHAYMVPHSWLDPAIAKKQSEKIAESLSKTYPELKKEIASNLESLVADLDALENEFKAANLTGMVVTSNPDAKYLTRALGFEEQHLLMFDLEKSTVADAMTRIQKLGDQQVDRLLWIETTSFNANEQAVETFQELFGDSAPPLVKVDLLDHAPDTGDYLSAMRNLLQKFEK